MRKFIAVFSLSIFIFIHFLSFQPVLAVSSVDYGEMLNTYLGAAETALAASQGVTIDWSGLDMPASSDTWTNKQKAQYIVQYVGNIKKVGQHAIYDWFFGPDNDTQDVISAQTAAIGLSTNSNIDNFDIKAQLDNILATQSQEHIFQRYTDKVIARWNEYNTNYINDYLNIYSFDSDNNVLHPDETYSTQLSKMNDITSNFDYFYFGNFEMWHPYGNSSILGYKYFPLTNYSFYSPNNDNISAVNRYWEAMPITSIHINSSDNTYIVTGLSEALPMYNLAEKVTINWYDRFSQFGMPNSTNINNVNKLVPYDSNYINDSVTLNFNWTFYNLYDAVTFVSKKFHNINLYVDNVQWASAFYNIDNPISVEVPDAVIDNSSEDGKIVAHPIYYPDALNTDKAIDIDLDKVIDAIASRIAQGDTDITFDDLVDAGAAVKLDGTTLTDADTIVQDVSVPIARAKVDTINGVIPTIDVVPPLPPLPPINPGDYSGEGFSGMSVLARIVNTTVQSLPEPVILTFFGVVFGAVILGIIKILHH